MNNQRFTDSAILVRERRITAVDEYIARLTLAIRSLSGSRTPVEQARKLRDRYARALFRYGPGVGGDAFVQFLLSGEAFAESDTDIDDRFMRLAEWEIDAATHAASAIREAMGRPLR
ncbi:MAG: hypothetical protein ABI887_06750 [Burkholderiales bacterium]